MHFVAILNRDGGTLRTTDLDAFSGRIHDILERNDHTVDVRIVAGSGLEKELSRAVKDKSVDVVMAGGGDGTISAAAAALMDKTDKALAILPAGTMNLFARSLGIPLSLDLAVEAFAGGHVKEIDVASANGKPFVHQFSIGMHAKMVHLRESMKFGSRLGKMRASAQAAYATVMNPPSMKVSLTIGDAELLTRTTGIGVTNNLFGEGHLPYADVPDGGVLGIYVTVARQRHELLRFFLNMARGRWRDNPHVEIHQSERVVLKIMSPRKKYRSVIDGELAVLEPETTIDIHPKALRVLVPSQADESGQA